MSVAELWGSPIGTLLIIIIAFVFIGALIVGFFGVR